VHRAHAAGPTGASLLPGIEAALSLSADLPPVIIIVDTEDKVRAVHPHTT
jgi:PII-like signaling protein